MMPENPTIEEARQRFALAQLPLPPIPTHMISSLERFDEFEFGTRDDTTGLYNFSEWVQEYLQGEVPQDYVAFGHAGHGFNSYAMHYYLVDGALAIFLQTAWGGINSSQAIHKTIVETNFAQIGMMIDWIRQNPLLSGESFVLIASDFSKSRWAHIRAGISPMWNAESSTLSAVTKMTAAIQTLLNPKA